MPAISETSPTQKCYYNRAAFKRPDAAHVSNPIRAQITRNLAWHNKQPRNFLLTPLREIADLTLVCGSHRDRGQPGFPQLIIHAR